MPTPHAPRKSALHGLGPAPHAPVPVASPLDEDDDESFYDDDEDELGVIVESRILPRFGVAHEGSAAALRLPDPRD
jgi:hypothetical protein